MDREEKQWRSEVHCACSYFHTGTGGMGCGFSDGKETAYREYAKKPTNSQVWWRRWMGINSVSSSMTSQRLQMKRARARHRANKRVLQAVRARLVELLADGRRKLTGVSGETRQTPGKRAPAGGLLNWQSTSPSGGIATDRANNWAGGKLSRFLYYYVHCWRQNRGIGWAWGWCPCRPPLHFSACRTGCRHQRETSAAYCKARITAWCKWHGASYHLCADWETPWLLDQAGFLACATTNRRKKNYKIYKKKKKIASRGEKKIIHN